MNDSALSIAVTDFSGKWSAIQSRIMAEGLISIEPNLNFPSDEISSPQFSCLFDTKPESTAIFQIFIIPFDNTFEKSHISQIEQWYSLHQDALSLGIVLNISKKWAVATNKSKIESLLKSQIDIPLVTIVKYTREAPFLSDSDFKNIHSQIEVLVKSEFERQINVLQYASETVPQSEPQYLQILTPLAILLFTCGFCSAAVKIFRKIRTIKQDPFWPEVPSTVDIKKRNIIMKFQTGFDIALTSLHCIVKDMNKRKILHEASSDLTWTFGHLLDHCTNESQFMFTRLFIHQTAAVYCEMMENAAPEIRDSIIPSFAMIALDQLQYIFESKADASDPFLANVQKGITSIRTTIGHDQIFITEWSRTRRETTNNPNSQRKLSAMFFAFLMTKDDVNGATSLMDGDSQLLPSQAATQFCALEGIVYSLLLSMDIDETEKKIAAQLVIESILAPSYKLKALDSLAGSRISPQRPLNIRSHAPRFYDAHDLYDSVPIAISFTVPDWLIGQELTIFLTAGSRHRTLQSDGHAVVPEEPAMVIDFNFFCDQPGNFSIFNFVIHIKETDMVWGFTCERPLIVRAPIELASFDLHLPYLLRPGMQQAANLHVSALDPYARTVTFQFQFDGLEDVIYDGQSCDIKRDIVIPSPGPSIELTLVYTLKAKESFDLNVLVESQDGDKQLVWQTFHLPAQSNFALRLFKQTPRHQQFQIVNIFPTSFTFDYEDEHHVIPPNASYYIVRKVTDAPFQITLHESGWEKYPITVGLSNFQVYVLTVKLEFDNDEQWQVGDSRIIKVDPPAKPLMDQEAPWIIVPVDKADAHYLLVPKRPGDIALPKFIVNDQVAVADPRCITIYPPQFPPFIPL